MACAVNGKAEGCRVYVSKPYGLERGKEEIQLLRAESPNYLLNVLSSDFLIMLPYSPKTAQLFPFYHSNDILVTWLSSD